MGACSLQIAALHKRMYPRLVVMLLIWIHYLVLLITLWLFVGKSSYIHSSVVSGLASPNVAPSAFDSLRPIRFSSVFTNRTNKRLQ